MNTLWRLVCVVCLLSFLAGCGIPLTGKLYSLRDAVTLEFEIETSRGTGDMRATNPKTGEKFTGQYTGIRKTTTVLLPTGLAGNEPANAADAFFRGLNGGLAGGLNNSAVIAPNYATARGVLAGDKGTMIELFMEIQPGLKPKGHGEGTDNKGGRYQVQF